MIRERKEVMTVNEAQKAIIEIDIHDELVDLLTDLNRLKSMNDVTEKLIGELRRIAEAYGVEEY